MKRDLRVVSLFTGAGGMDLGFTQEGFKVEWAVDNDYPACETYRRNLGEAVVNRDISEVDFTEVPDCDVIIGGFPCQDFSVIWQRPGLHGLRGDLYRQFVRAVAFKQPRAFVAENVKGLLSANKGRAISQIKSDFAKLGYRIFSRIFSFVQYGVPQFRERLIIVGLRADVKFAFKTPEPTHGPRTNNPYSTAGDALKGVEKVKQNNELIGIQEKTKQLLSLIPPGGNFSNVPKTSEHYVKGLMSNIYRRLEKDKPAYTVVAAGGGGTWTYHYSELRALTNRERARLQTFPDDFEFFGTTGEVRKQIGNAVPPEGIRPIAKALKLVLDGSAQASTSTLETYIPGSADRIPDKTDAAMKWLRNDAEWNSKRRSLSRLESSLHKFGLPAWRGAETYSPGEVKRLLDRRGSGFIKRFQDVISSHIDFHSGYYGGTSENPNPRMDQCEYNLHEAVRLLAGRS